MVDSRSQQSILLDDWWVTYSRTRRRNQYFLGVRTCFFLLFPSELSSWSFAFHRWWSIPVNRSVSNFVPSSLTSLLYKKLLHQIILFHLQRELQIKRFKDLSSPVIQKREARCRSDLSSDKLTKVFLNWTKLAREQWSLHVLVFPSPSAS